MSTKKNKKISEKGLTTSTPYGIISIDKIITIKGGFKMFTVFDKKDRKLMIAKSFEFALEGLRKGKYKAGEYRKIFPNGKEKVVVKYNH